LATLGNDLRSATVTKRGWAPSPNGVGSNAKNNGKETADPAAAITEVIRVSTLF
jgi:hypothetical protein